MSHRWSLIIKEGYLVVYYKYKLIISGFRVAQISRFIIK